MNGLFLAVSCLGALATIALAEPTVQDLKREAVRKIEQPGGQTTSAKTTQPTLARAAKAPVAVAKGTGSMITRTIIESDPTTGEETVTEERVIAFQD